MTRQRVNPKGKKYVDPEKVEALAAQGLTMKQIASCLGICQATLYNRMGSEVEVLEAIEKGRAKGVAVVSNRLFEDAKNGNTTAQIFYLKNRAPEEWRDRHEVMGELRTFSVELTGVQVNQPIEHEDLPRLEIADPDENHVED